MLVSFTLGNWRSFREKATFSMVPTAERRFGWSLPAFPRAPKKLLPIAAIYGANASGKSNFFKGLAFLAKFVLRGAEVGNTIPVAPYRLDPSYEKNPSFFSVMFIVNEITYEYTLALTSKEIYNEKLSTYVAGNEKVLFKREKGNEFYVNDSLEEQERIRFVYQGTQDNFPFLTNAFRQKISFVQTPYQWFRHKLIFIGSESHYGAKDIFINGSSFQKELGEYLARYDTGITEIKSEEEDFPNLPDPAYLESFRDGEILEAGKERVCIIKNDEDIKIAVLNTVHRDSCGNEVAFNFKEESDGTKRLLDILPALLLCNSYPDAGLVFIIDEIDRSMHSNLIYKLITDYISNSSEKTRFQMIMTTHDLGLMNQKLLRRDEMWIIDKANNVSNIYSISDFNRELRFDSALQSIYKNGYLGGIPRVVIPDLPPFKDHVARQDHHHDE